MTEGVNSFACWTTSRLLVVQIRVIKPPTLGGSSASCLLGITNRRWLTDTVSLNWRIKFRDLFPIWQGRWISSGPHSLHWLVFLFGTEARAICVRVASASTIVASAPLWISHSVTPLWLTEHGDRFSVKARTPKMNLKRQYQVRALSWIQRFNLSYN